MKDYLLELLAKHADHNVKLNMAREYLQAYALRALYNSGMFRTTAFLGGTALRFFYDLPRFSQDLDFSIMENPKYSFEDILKKIKSEFILGGYNADVSYNEKQAVQSAFLKFHDLMYEAGMSPHKNQILSIKIEIDSKPPSGAVSETRIINKYFPIAFLSYDLPSLFAGKLHAILSRKYIKGRDYFDLAWYLSKWTDISPNFILLENSLIQTGWKGEMPNKKIWRVLIREKIKKTDWKAVNDDVKNFLENPADMKVFSKENILLLLEKK
ncbi:MAG: nucleotidyl transferase AbiEii/AbiGii toxin family protein [Elusimicrobiota bacterium]|nr:nucleotidyl transferase AbiEii/AbiGii toxin family protein [Elusimicrobiota bacterium]